MRGRSSGLAAVLLLCAGCSGALRGGTFNNPLTVAQPQAVAYDGHVRHMGAWLDSSRATNDFTTFVTYWISCDEPAPQIDPDTRQIVWFASLFNYGPTARSLNGYSLRPDAASCWQTLKAIITNHRERSIAVWLLDEPDAVAWGDMVPGGPYDANIYNTDIQTACSIVRADFPDLPVAVNYGGAAAGLIVPSCLSRVGLEAYRADWQNQLQMLETQTALPIWLMPPAFATGDPAMADPVLAQRVRDQWAWSQHDARVDGLYYFLQCCDDLVTGSKDFYAVGGGHLPLTRAALEEIGRAIVTDSSK